MNRKNYILQVLGRFIWFFIFSGVIIATCIIVENNGPAEIIYNNESFNYTSWTPTNFTAENNIIFDAHSHTIYSDGVLSVEQNILWHIAHGYNACAITDHNTLNHKSDLEKMAAKYLDKIIVILGMEWTTKRIHMNFIGISEWNDPIPSNPTDDQIKEAINKAHAQNAIVIVNHIPWSLARGMNHPSRQQLLEWNVDYIEVVNEGDLDTESYYNWCNNSGGFGMITGTDMHRPNKVYGWTGLNVTEFTAEAVLNQLRARNTTIYYNETGADDYAVGEENPAYKIIKPMALIGELFENYEVNGKLDWQGIGIFAGYMIGVFIISEILRILNRKFWDKINSKRQIAKTE